MELSEEDRKKLLKDFAEVCPREGRLTEMPFGKFKGRKIVQLPNWYLHDLASQDWLKSNLRPAIDAEVLRRLQTPREDAVG